MKQYILLFVFAIHSLKAIHSYNIDTNSPLVKSIPSSANSSFGFSLSMFKSKSTNTTHILVGSPTDQINNSSIKTSGAFYTCPLTKNYKDCVQRSIGYESENSLFGYTIVADTVDNAIYTCAPRVIKSLSNVNYVEGSCWEFDDKYNLVDSIPNKDCIKAILKNPRDYEYRNCLTGGAVTSLGNKRVLMTAPYSYEGRGLLIDSQFRSDINSRESDYIRVDNYVAKYQLAGLSMALGKIFRDKTVRTVILGAPGMPQSNLTNFKSGSGQVMLLKLVNDSLSFNGFIFGDTFGSGFGYSVLAMDLNGDGYDELVIGAPFTGNNRGSVFIYWNLETQQSSEGGYSFPLSINKPLVLQNLKKGDKSQFGNCLENIGDINKDLILDLAVGSPFEEDGRGSVFIYLGSRSGHVTLSQKIDASRIDPDFRGFGFSIWGKNTDIDGNSYPDVVVGAVVSGHAIVLRTRPLITIYAENMLPSTEYLIPYNLEKLSKCPFEGRNVPCQKITISIFYHYSHSKECSANSKFEVVNFTVDLDGTFINSSHSKRVHFEDRSTTVSDSISIGCKPPSLNLTSESKQLSILFSSVPFFNTSLPIDIVLSWSRIDAGVPKRDHRAEDTLVDLFQYPQLDRANVQMINKIIFGAGCLPENCKPILTFEAELALEKDREEYILQIGSSSSFILRVNVRNTATIAEGKAFNTFVKVDYVQAQIVATNITPGPYRSTLSGLIYAVSSPLEPMGHENISFVFSLTNDFIQGTEKYIILNISVDTMTKQPQMVSVTMRIRIRMVANIDMTVSVTQMDSASYHQIPILGISAISHEKQIGPRLKMNIALTNIEQASVVLSSKLVIYFPWEVTGNAAESHGQYLLYLQTMPKFFITGGKRNITCDEISLQRLVNPIKIKIFESTTDNSQIKDVSLGNVPMPKKAPKPPTLRNKLILVSNDDESLLQSAWGSNVILDCMNGSARCLPVVCDLGPLSRQSGEINIELEFRIWIHTFVENFIKYKFVQTEIPIFWIPEVDYDIILHNPGGSFQSVGIKIDNLQKPSELPSTNVMCVVLFSAAIGVIILAAIILILKKCQFFRRRNVATERKRKRNSEKF